MTILVVVESPAKVDKIQKFLGPGYKVGASYGHIRDLDPKSMSINFDNKYEPIYVVTKPEQVSKLKNAMKGVDMLYVASDKDYEGSAIGQALLDILKPKRHLRLIFGSITKEEVLKAVKNAKELDQNHVAAQKTRRVLDRIFGYLISPLVQKHLGDYKLSAGRTQSPAVKLVIEKEDEINNFLTVNRDATFFKVSGTFAVGDDPLDILKATLHMSSDEKAYRVKEAYAGSTAKIKLSKDLDRPNAKVVNFLKRCLKSEFAIHDVSEKTAYRSPSAPFTTSTLQQEAYRKFGMPIDMTMKVAQTLYEGGYITYMRTDSTDISPEGHKEIKKTIIEEYGERYYEKNTYDNKSAMEAHEAIRPVHPDLLDLEKEVEDESQIKLYKLIWQRTIASQMAKAKLNITTIQISISKFIEQKLDPFYYFQSQIEKVVFAGFMKVYIESTDDPENEADTVKGYKGEIPEAGSTVVMDKIVAKQEFLRPPTRYTQASLVKKLEAMGIGRPSTFVNIIKTILDRKYVEVKDVEGITKPISVFTIQSSKGKNVMRIEEEDDEIFIGKEKKKIVPTDLGRSVLEYLIKNFPNLLDYQFTSNLEKEMDDVANGKKTWYKIVDKFYKEIKPTVDELSAQKSMSKASEVLLGTDPDDNKIYAGKNKYGPLVRKEGSDGKSIFAQLEPPLTLDNVTLKAAIKLLANAYPKVLGTYLKKEVILKKGTYGKYLVYGKANIKLPDIYAKGEDDPDLEMAIKIISEKESSILAKYTVKLGDANIKIEVLTGKYGPYMKFVQGKNTKFVSIPEGTDPKEMTEEQIIELINAKKKKFSKKGGGAGKTTKKASSKKSKK